jgi:hypothetical protein
MKKPDNWVVLKMKKGDEKPTYKIFASWLGGYLDGDQWKMNSGITKVDEHDTYIDFHGYSGSVYRCIKGTYGTGTSWTGSVLNNFIETASEICAEITILPDDTDWLSIT